ncbi:MAG: lipocalin family protein [Paracoccaceae bacterium]|nr:lipocalin family protein [Paracoccaceae bacterium]
MRQLILALPLILAACAQAANAPVGAGAARMQAKADLVPARLAGDWHEIAGFYDPAESGCSIGLSRIAPEGRDLRVTLSDCAGLGSPRLVAEQTSGPGHYLVRGAGRLTGPWWVLWTDPEYRALVIASPRGEFGGIFSRTPRMPAGLYLAARRALTVAGFDMAQLRPDLRSPS